SESDVLSRYYEAAQEYGADIIVRLTSDCPVIDPLIIDKTIQLYIQQQQHCDYVSNSLQRTYPRGMDTEVFSFHTLETCYHNGQKPEEREHVTPYIYTNPDKFRMLNKSNQVDQSMYRLTVDTVEDFQLIEQVI